MRITTWNVNGLRAVMGKNLFNDLPALDTDVLCLQEIKTRPEQLKPEMVARLAEVFPYVTWNPAERPGYSGTATFSKVAPETVDLGLGSEEFDNEGRVIVHRYPGFYLYNIYFPNGRNDLTRVPFKLDFYARLLKICDERHARGESVILCGDFNTAHNEIDLKHPKENAKATGFLPEERVWIDHYLDHYFVDAFRKMYPERVEYTWWTYISNARARNVGWRLDYFLVSEPLYERVEDVCHYQAVLGSDHCPVTLKLRD